MKTNRTDSLFDTIAVYDMLGAEYANRIARVKPPELQEFISKLPRKAKVLDVGCAAGRDSAVMRDAGLEVVGIDLLEILLNIARKKVAGVDFRLMDARKMDLEDKTFDGIWALAILLNLERIEVQGVLREFWRIMMPGGACFIGAKEGIGERLVSEDLVNNMKRRETYFGKLEMEGLLKRVGFEIDRSHVADDHLGRTATKWIYIFAKKPV